MFYVKVWHLFYLVHVFNVHYLFLSAECNFIQAMAYGPALQKGNIYSLHPWEAGVHVVLVGLE